MEKLVLIVHVLTALAIIGLILLQQGKGADMGASFGSGASQTVFGSEGGGNFFTRMTAILATVFFITSFGLAIIAKDTASVAVDSGIPNADMLQELPAAVEQSASDFPMTDFNEIDNAADDVPASDVPAQ